MASDHLNPVIKEAGCLVFSHGPSILFVFITAHFGSNPISPRRWSAVNIYFYFLPPWPRAWLDDYCGLAKHAVYT